MVDADANKKIEGILNLIDAHEFHHKSTIEEWVKQSFLTGYELGKSTIKPSRSYAGMSNNEIFGHPC